VTFINVVDDQGDQIERFFAHREFVFHGQFFENYIINQKFWATFSTEKVMH
jgi:hypothetical protein